VYLLYVELTRLAGLYHLSYILEGGWPVKAMPEGLTNQCAGCGMTSALTSMDLREQLTALLLGNAPHENTVGATTVEIPFHHRVSLSQPHYALCGHMIFRKDIFFQVVPDLGDPCIRTTLRYWLWHHGVGRTPYSTHSLRWVL
jgi:hypothetical protein